MASSESQEAEKSRIETSHAEFNALILRHKAMIWHICSDYRLGSAWNTEDCVQEVIMNLWRSFKSFEGRSSEKTWVWRVATNTMLMLRRKDVRSPQTEPIVRKMPWSSESSPATTMVMAMDVSTDDDWMMAVSNAPMNTISKGLLMVAKNCFT